jgi:phosphatidylserine/phosphatidylglycerophosphate/cardiolipin synthase-like enzyme
MTIVQEQSLISTLRDKADSVSVRLWLAAHYIGEPSSIRKILGTRWLRDRSVSVRLLIDSTHLESVDTATLQLFRNRGEVRVLAGLHAKLYICDDVCFLTSANLTETAFGRRYEIGAMLDGPQAIEVVEVFERWWTIGIALDPLNASSDGTREPGTALGQLWTMPNDPDAER